MSLDFPTDPVDGQVYENYVYSDATGAWRASNSAQTFPVQISNGGTGAATVADAQDNLLVGPVRLLPTTINNSGGSASVNANGLVTFSAANSIALNGVFSSSFSVYEIVIDLTGASTDSDVIFQFRNAGTSVSTSTYAWGRGVLSNSALSFVGGAGLNAATSMNIFTAFSGFPGQWAKLTISNAGQSLSKRIAGDSGGLSRVLFTGFNSTASSFDGFIIYPATGGVNFSGKIQVNGIGR